MPIYTYRAPCGHTWDEHRGTHVGSEISADPCPTCMEADEREAGHEPQHGTKIVPTSIGRPIFKGRGWTPTYYPNNKGNK